MPEKTTIKTIARDLGISHMTVSRALTGHPNVRKETRDAIVARAEELGYVKSAAARAMRGSRIAVVGILLPNISNEFYAHYANELAGLCADRNLSPVIHLTNDNPEREKAALRSLRALQASAVVMVPASEHALTEGDLAFDRVVQLIRQRPGDAADGAVLIEDRPALQSAVSHLVAKGCRRIAYIGGFDLLTSGRDRLAACLDALLSEGLDPNPDLIVTGAPGYALGNEAMATLLDKVSPDGLVCGGLEISNGALDMLLRRGVDVARDLAFVGYGDPPYYRWVGGGITTVSLPIIELAAATIELLAMDPASSAAPVVHRKAILTVRGPA